MDCLGCFVGLLGQLLRWMQISRKNPLRRLAGECARSSGRRGGVKVVLVGKSGRQRRAKLAATGLTWKVVIELGKRGASGKIMLAMSKDCWTYGEKFGTRRQSLCTRRSRTSTRFGRVARKPIGSSKLGVRTGTRPQLGLASAPALPLPLSARQPNRAPGEHKSQFICARTVVLRRRTKQLHLCGSCPISSIRPSSSLILCR